MHDNVISTFCFRKWTCRSKECCSSVEAGSQFGQGCILSTENIMKPATSVSYYSLVAENKFHRCSHHLWCIINLYLALLYKVLWKIFKHGASVPVVYSASWRFLHNGLLCIIIIIIIIIIITTGSSSRNIWSRSCETASVMASYDCYLMPYNSDIWACCIHMSCWPSAENLGCLWLAFFLWKTL